jgi:Glu-tRNA(Gln) amidotransferase subunit E-like FAD-binding protein
MLPTFEEHTMPLTPEELACLRQVLSIWEVDQSRCCCIDKQIIPYLREVYNLELTHGRVQKLLSALRKMGKEWNGKILISSGLGYYWTDDIDEIETYCKTHEMRCESINALRESAMEYIRKRTGGSYRGPFERVPN